MTLGRDAAQEGILIAAEGYALPEEVQVPGGNEIHLS
jgi:hypothetical protein